MITDVERRETRQRELILSVVRSTMDHPTADWVYRQARRRLPRLSLGTVYRNLKWLAAHGLIGEVHTGGHPARFDGNTGQHYHIRCLGCGRVNDLPMSVDHRLEQEAGRAMNYRILGHQVEVQGLCPQCQGAPLPADNDSRGSTSGPRASRTTIEETENP
jgi:Fe2+ or Zn2+ uptake regulation protein